MKKNAPRVYVPHWRVKRSCLSRPRDILLAVEARWVEKDQMVEERSRNILERTDYGRDSR